jgi:hypothetical protein
MHLSCGVSTLNKSQHPGGNGAAWVEVTEPDIKTYFYLDPLYPIR